jgi:hypothetical protein
MSYGFPLDEIVDDLGIYYASVDSVVKKAGASKT